MKCKICGSDAPFFSEADILKKHHVKYYKCSSCGFIQTEAPYWLSEAYSDAITELEDLMTAGDNLICTTSLLP